MTAYLLDTHTVLWLINSPDRVPTGIREELSAGETIRLISPVVAIEAATKYRLGKLNQAAPLVNNWMLALAELAATETPVTYGQAITAGTLPWPHRDPWDRLLAAQAMDLGVPLVTADAVFTGLAETNPIFRLAWQD